MNTHTSRRGILGIFAVGLALMAAVVMLPSHVGDANAGKLGIGISTSTSNSTFTGNTTFNGTTAFGNTVSWNTGVGAVTQLTGPTDQTFKISSGAGRPLQLLSASGQNISILPAGAGNIQAGAQVAFVTGLGAISQIIGPSDQPFKIQSGAGQKITMAPVSGQDLLLSVAGGGSLALNGLEVFQTGLGVAVHITGPSDQSFGIAAGAGQSAAWKGGTSGTAMTVSSTGVPTITSPVISTGMTASGSAANNFGGSTGAFTTSTGLLTLIGSSINAGDGTVSQATNINTGVTVVGSSGVITTQTATTAGLAVETGFTVTDTSCLSTSVVLARVVAYSGTYGTNGFPEVAVSAVNAGNFAVKVMNYAPVNALNGTLKIHFACL